MFLLSLSFLTFTFYILHFYIFTFLHFYIETLLFGLLDGGKNVK